MKPKQPPAETSTLEYTDEEAKRVEALLKKLQAVATKERANGLTVARACCSMAVGLIKATGGDRRDVAMLLAEAWEATEAGIRG